MQLKCNSTKHVQIINKDKSQAYKSNTRIEKNSID